MKPRPRVSPRSILVILILLILLVLAAFVYLLRPDLFQQGSLLPTPIPTLVLPVENTRPPEEQPTQTLTPSSTPSLVPGTSTNTAVPISFQSSRTPAEAVQQQGVLVLALRDGYYTHLFAYHPLYLPLTRLTNNPWDDITPAISPDGTRLAYSSRQNGYWDLYVLDLATGKQTRLTDTPDYEASPTWSPDGQWIAFERYNGVSQDIYVLSLAEENAQPVQLTNDPGVDRSPAWSPKGREIAFVSTRSGDEEIWLARLDDAEHRFVNLSHQPLSRDRFPAWSKDGQWLSWASEQSGNRNLAVWDTSKPDQPARLLSEGDRSTWSPDGKLLFSEVREPNETYLAAYASDTGRLAVPLTAMPGTLSGMVWVPGPLPAWLSEQIQKADTSPAPALWQPVMSQPLGPGGRVPMVTLPDITAPQPMLSDEVDDAFNALRQEVKVEVGWDTLSSLENAFVPLTNPPTPSIQTDWLFTGRAFAFNPLLLSANWVSIAREDFSGQTYWRVFLKARYQDGSMGMPLNDMAWDVNARTDGNPRDYEQGGKLMPVPAGYWIDLTELANRYEWERVPSTNNWRTFYPSIRFNLFVMTGGLDWDQAMQEIYPVEALATPTPLPTYTPVPSRTPKEPVEPTDIPPTPTLTVEATRRPTWTPLPVQP